MPTTNHRPSPDFTPLPANHDHELLPLASLSPDSGPACVCALSLRAAVQVLLKSASRPLGVLAVALQTLGLPLVHATAIPTEP